jgi:flavin reductase ActVB
MGRDRDRSVTLAGDFTVEPVAGRIETDTLLADELRYDVVDEGMFKAAMRMLASGVAMVTTNVGGRPWGLTISSCCSVSARPPQILVALGRSTKSCQKILASRVFGLSILATSHKDLAERGAAVGAAKFVDEFCETIGEHALDAPVVTGALFHLQCRATQVHTVSDHDLIVGVVERAVAPWHAEATSPLLFFDRRFWKLGDPLTTQTS